MDEDGIILIFETKEKKTKFPKDIEDLRNICNIEFGIKYFENYSFYYEPTDSTNITEIKDEFNFGNLKPDNNNPNKNKIVIKEKDLNESQSILYNHELNSEIRATNFFGTNSSNLINKNDKEELSEHNNKSSDELNSNMNSVQSQFNTQEYGGRAPSKTTKELENQIDNKYNLKQSSQKSDKNENNNSNQNSSVINNYEVNNNNNDLHTKKINAKFVENNEINNSNLEINKLKEKISKLENDIENKDKLLNEKINLIKKQEQQVQNLTVKICQKNIFEFNKEKYKKLIQEKDQKISSLEEENKRLKKEFDNSKKQYNQLYKNNNELTKENKNLKEQLKKIENSRSETIRDNIGCNKRDLIIIKGYRDKYSGCNNYNLFQQCSEIILDYSLINISREKIQQFREIYKTPSAYTDDSIAKALVETRGNFEDAYFKLFIDN